MDATYIYQNYEPQLITHTQDEAQYISHEHSKGEFKIYVPPFRYVLYNMQKLQQDGMANMSSSEIEKLNPLFIEMYKNKERIKRDSTKILFQHGLHDLAKTQCANLQLLQTLSKTGKANLKWFIDLKECPDDIYDKTGDRFIDFDQNTYERYVRKSDSINRNLFPDITSKWSFRPEDDINMFTKNL